MSIFTIFEGIDAASVDKLTTRRGMLQSSGRLASAAAITSVPALFMTSARKLHASGAPAAFGVPAAAIPVLNFALTLEYLEAEFYVMGVASGVIPSADRNTFITIRDHEVAHVAYLQAALGADAVAKPTFDFTAGGVFSPFTNYDTFKILAQGFEDTGVRAYKGQLPALQPFDAILTAAATIHSVEARHASQVRRLRGQKGWIPFEDPMAPAAIKPVYDGEGNLVHLGINVAAFQGAEAGTEAFDEPMTMQQVLAIADPFIV